MKGVGDSRRRDRDSNLARIGGVALARNELDRDLGAVGKRRQAQPGEAARGREARIVLHADPVARLMPNMQAALDLLARDVEIDDAAEIDRDRCNRSTRTPPSPAPRGGDAGNPPPPAPPLSGSPIRQQAMPLPLCPAPPSHSPSRAAR